MPVKFSSRIRSDLGPALLLNRLFGLFPYEFGSLHLLYCSLIVPICLSSSISASLFVNLTGGNRQNYDVFILSIFRTVSIVPWITTCYLFVKSFLIRSEIATVMACVSAVASRFKFRERRRSIFRSSFMYDLAFRAVMTSYATCAAYQYVKGALQPFLIRLVGIYLTLLLQNVYDLQFLAFVKHVKFWFELIRKRLTTSAVGLLIDCHKDLSAACRALEAAYSVQVFLSLSTCFLLNMIDFYVLCVTGRSNLLSAVSVQVLFRLGLRIYQIVAIVFYVDQLCNQARAFDKSLMALLLTDHTRTLERDAKVKAHLSRKNIVKFTGGSMFVVDSTLTHSMAAITINYLIILIQFGGSDHKI